MRFPVLLAACALLIAPSRVSDPIGVYALIDRVELEPNDQAPERIRIWGVFALADGMVIRDGQPVAYDMNRYHPAQRGFLFYRVNQDNAKATLAEWADMKTVAGTGRVIGFGSRFGQLGTVRRANGPATPPDTFPLGFGIAFTLTSNGPDQAYEILRVPAPVSPADDGRAPAGSVQLVARNVTDATVMYVFEIEGPGGATETSPPLSPGEGQTRWTPRVQLKNGETYTWRVHTTKAGWSSQPAVATFGVGDREMQRR
jgi:hypothetical protein